MIRKLIKDYKYIKPILNDLRRSFLQIFFFILLGFFICYVKFNEIHEIFIHPIINIKGKKLIYSGLFDVIFFQIKFCFLTSIVLFLPIISFIFVKFVNKSLHKHERFFFRKIVIFLNLFLYLNIFLVYKFIIPYIVKYLNQNYSEFNAYITIFSYLNIFIMLIFAMMIIFFIPILLILLLKKNVINYLQMEKYRKHFVVFIFVLTGFFAPPDAFSQIFMSFIIIIIYEVIIIWGKNFLPKVKNKKFHHKKKIKKSYHRLLKAKARLED